MRYFFLLLFIGVSSISISQNFTKERDKFVKECQRAFVDPDQALFVREKLSKMIQSPGFTETQFAKMVDLSNSIYNSTSDYSFVYPLVKSCLFQSSNKFSGNFNSEWAKYLVDYQNEDAEELLAFLNFSSELFEFHSINSGDGFRWVFLKGELSWKKDKSLKLVCDD